MQDNDPYNLTVVNVGPGEKQTVALVPRGTYCIMEVPMGDKFDLGVKYSRKFTATEFTTNTEFTTEKNTGIIELSTADVIGLACKLVSSLLVCIDIIRVSTCYPSSM